MNFNKFYILKVIKNFFNNLLFKLKTLWIFRLCNENKKYSFDIKKN